MPTCLLLPCRLQFYVELVHFQSYWLAGSDRAGGVDGERKMFLAKLLVGNSVELSRHRSLTVPPINPKPGQKYQTVPGEMGESKDRIVYGMF